MIELNKKAKPLYGKFSKWLSEKEIDCFLNIELVGSQAICNPPPGDKSDIDLLCLLSSWNDADSLVDLGWKDDDDEGNYPQDEFVSYRKGNINLILTTYHSWFKEFVRAKDLCKKLNATDKEMRKTIHAFFLKDVGKGGIGLGLNEPVAPTAVTKAQKLIDIWAATKPLQFIADEI